MDLSFSPDWPAWFCYLIVLFFGLLTGWREIVEKLNDASEVWRRPSTWALIFLLGVGPIALFWVLDRVGALHDTSAIAAAIVGVAYTQILKGDSGYKAPGSTSPIWNFLSWWRDRVAKTVQDRAANNALAFDQVVCERLAAAPTLDAAAALALKLAIDPIAFQTELAAKRAALAAAAPPLDAAVIDYKIAERVYKEIRTDPGFRALMISHALIDQAVVDRFFRPSWPPWITGGVVVAGIAALVVLGIVVDRTGIGRWVEREYLVVRLAKTSGTVNDLDRTSARLTRMVVSQPPATADAPAPADFWLRPLLDVLDDTTLPMVRVEATLRIFLSARDKGALDRRALAERLVPMLRNTNVDARRRIQMGLAYLAEGTTSDAFDKEKQDGLMKWNPTEGDSIVTVEHRIDMWRVYWLKAK